MYAWTLWIASEHFFCAFFAQLFAYIKKKQYLCSAIRFCTNGIPCKSVRKWRKTSCFRHIWSVVLRSCALEPEKFHSENKTNGQRFTLYGVGCLYLYLFSWVFSGPQSKDVEHQFHAFFVSILLQRTPFCQEDPCSLKRCAFARTYFLGCQGRRKAWQQADCVGGTRAVCLAVASEGVVCPLGGRCWPTFLLS